MRFFVRVALLVFPVMSLFQDNCFAVLNNCILRYVNFNIIITSTLVLRFCLHCTKLLLHFTGFYFDFELTYFFVDLLYWAGFWLKENLWELSQQIFHCLRTGCLNCCPLIGMKAMEKYSTHCFYLIYTYTLYTVLSSVSRRELIYTLQSRQLRFLGHLLRSERALYALYEPQHGSTRRGLPRTNFISYIQKLTELTDLSQDRDAWRQLVVEGVDLQPPSGVFRIWQRGGLWRARGARAVSYTHLTLRTILRV